jgi:RNA polymerase sigma factor (sigma-70 family)
MHASGNLAGWSGHLEVMALSDASLWARARAGDADAFGLLFQRHARVIYNFLFRSTADWAVADDLLSVVFLEAWRRRDKELEEGYVLPWLYGIAANVLRNRRRSERRFAAALRRLPKAEFEPDFSPAADERVDDERRIRQALDLLGALPEREQEVFRLCAWMELSYEDAAFALGLPIGTIRSRLSRARARLRELEAGRGHLEGGDPLSDQ